MTLEDSARRRNVVTLRACARASVCVCLCERVCGCVSVCLCERARVHASLEGFQLAALMSTAKGREGGGHCGQCDALHYVTRRPGGPEGLPAAPAAPAACTGPRPGPLAWPGRGLSIPSSFRGCFVSPRRWVGCVYPPSMHLTSSLSLFLPPPPSVCLSVSLSLSLAW